jgi:hypothetical protein
VLPMGPDTYTVTENVILSMGGGVAAQGKAIKEANEFCASKERQFLAMNYQSVPQGGSVSYSLTFRLLPNDPELRRPNYRPEPNVVIEHR